MTALVDGLARELSWSERTRWGECPVCHAPHGRSCDGNVGIALGRTIAGRSAGGWRASGPAPARAERHPRSGRQVRELVVDSFAGGGGASLGIETALGRGPDIAIDHDPEALAMHRANHPETLHLTANVWKVDPIAATRGRPVGLLWASPDCKHHSKAKGGKPVKREIRDLAWVVVRWARQVRPRVIALENVEEFRDCGPVLVDGTPCRARKGQIFDAWAGELRRLGYRVEWRELRACDYGAPTIRKRLFVIARRDGAPIVWPAPTHGAPDSPQVLAGLRKPWRTAAEIIDWSLPCPSIFLSREAGRALGCNRPLAENTMARIAKGVRRYVIDSTRPVVVPTANGASLVAAFLAQHNTDMVGHDAREPLSTIVGKGCTQAVVSAGMLNLKGSDRRAGSIASLVATICAAGAHAAEVRAFLVKYYGEGGVDQACADPLHTVPTRGRFGLVSVSIDGEPWAIVDIGMRMLTPRELFRAQGFPESYEIAAGLGADGEPVRLTKTAQVRMCGNSVCPPLAAAIVAANYEPREIAGQPPRPAGVDLPLFAGAV